MMRPTTRIVLQLLFLAALLAGCQPAPPSPTDVPTPLPTATLTPLSSVTSEATPTYGSALISRRALACAPQENYLNCEDDTLGIRFEVPAAWGQIEATLRTGGYSGYAYDYTFGGLTIGEAEPLLAGGRSLDFSEGRGGMPTDYSGFGTLSAEERCAEVSETYAHCEEIQPGVIWMLEIPDSRFFCDFAYLTKFTPVVRIEINLPDNPTIQGFVFEAPFLSEELASQLDGELLPILGMTENGAQSCYPDNRQEFDEKVQEFIVDLQAGMLDNLSMLNLDALRHLAESISGE